MWLKSGSVVGWPRLAAKPPSDCALSPPRRMEESIGKAQERRKFVGQDEDSLISEGGKKKEKKNIN